MARFQKGAFVDIHGKRRLPANHHGGILVRTVAWDFDVQTHCGEPFFGRFFLAAARVTSPASPCYAEQQYTGVESAQSKLHACQTTESSPQSKDTLWANNITKS